MKGHSSPVRILAYSTCGRRIAFSNMNIVRLWDLHDAEQRYILVDAGAGNDYDIEGLKFSPTGHQLAIYSMDGKVWLFDPRTRVLLTSKELMEKEILAWDYSPNGQQLALGTRSSIALWDLRSDESHLELHVQPTTSQDVYSNNVTTTYSPCGQFLTYTGTDCVVHLWRRRSVEGDIETWSWACALCVFHDFITSFSWNPAVPTEFITSNMDGSVRVWRLSSDDETLSVKMLWGTSLRRLCTIGVVLEGATGLSSIHQKLLEQRSALDRVLILNDKELIMNMMMALEARMGKDEE